MTLKSIFNKPVDRPIEGVIKADDEESLRLELEEYVLTNVSPNASNLSSMPTTTQQPQTVSGSPVSSDPENRIF